jgi:hypothetical protein
MEHQLTTLFHALADSEIPPIIQLLNKERKPVGALYLNKVKYKNFIVSDTNNSEKYYLYVDGVGIYFSFYQKLNP